MNNTELTQAARGFGRRARMQGVRRDLAVRYTVTLHPEMSGYEKDIAKGWNAQKAGR